MAYELPLTKGMKATIDAEDAPLVGGHKWCVNGKGYVSSKMDGKQVQLHRVLLADELSKGMQVDHVNGDKLDNRRSNLRVCTPAQNMANQRARNGYKGVSYSNSLRQWRASIRHNYRFIHIGYFAVPEAAARAYDQKARELKGEFAWINGV